MPGCRTRRRGAATAALAIGTSSKARRRRRYRSATTGTRPGTITAASRSPASTPRCDLPGALMAYDRNNVFARILRGELPCNKVYEDEHVLAFRDIHPQAPVHIVVIPKGEYVSVDDFAATASEAEQAGFIRAIGHIARAEGVAEGGYR